MRTTVFELRSGGVVTDVREEPGWRPFEEYDGKTLERIRVQDLVGAEYSVSPGRQLIRVGRSELRASDGNRLRARPDATERARSHTPTRSPRRTHQRIRGRLSLRTLRVFLVSRMREEWDNRHDNVAAVTGGLERTGRLVTAAGLIMFAAFMGFVAGSIVGLQQFGFGLAVAILIDVTIIRALLVPSVMKLFGRWNWWLPERVARIARVEPSPLAPRQVSPAPALRPAGR
jgi:uncharacterized membrane protein YdfJ with MMPL/SSD domain